MKIHVKGPNINRTFSMPDLTVVPECVAFADDNGLPCIFVFDYSELPSAFWTTHHYKQVKSVLNLKTAEEYHA